MKEVGTHFIICNVFFSFPHCFLHISFCLAEGSPNGRGRGRGGRGRPRSRGIPTLNSEMNPVRCLFSCVRDLTYLGSECYMRNILSSICCIFLQGMVLSLLSTRMEAGTAIVVMLGVEAEEEDEVSVAGDVAATMDLSLIGSKMEDTIMKPLLKVAVVGFLTSFVYYYIVLVCVIVLWVVLCMCNQQIMLVLFFLNMLQLESF